MLNAYTQAAVDFADALMQWEAHGDTCTANEQTGSTCTECAELDAVHDGAHARYKAMQGTHGIEREKLPAKRYGVTQKLTVNGTSVHVSPREYPDGRIGELWIDLHRYGTTFRGIMGCFATAVSIGIQYGIPLHVFIDKFVHTKFGAEAGVVQGDVRIAEASSIVDLVFKWLALDYDLEIPNEPPKL